MLWTQEEKNEVYINAMQKAASNESFRKEILADPIAALEKLSGKKIPEGTSIKVIEQDPAYESTMVLPKFVGDSLELEDLDQVAGGEVTAVYGKFIVTWW